MEVPNVQGSTSTRENGNSGGSPSDLRVELIGTRGNAYFCLLCLPGSVTVFKSLCFPDLDSFGGSTGPVFLRMSYMEIF